MPPRAGAAFTLRFDHAGLSPEHAPAPARFRRFEGGVDSAHRVVAFEPPHRLVITWGGGSEAPSEVTFELTPAGDQVRLVLTHRRLDETGMPNVAGGWHTHLAILADRLAGRTPPAFWALFARAEAAYARRLAGPGTGGPQAKPARR